MNGLEAAMRQAIKVLAEDCDYLLCVIRLSGVPGAIAGDSDAVRTFLETLDKVKLHVDNTRGLIGEDAPAPCATAPSVVSSSANRENP